jgi:3-hydroxyacyl-CoA dehydrogenase / enoyl-CoA hydratase / 3-hydroxybutyryl-CoA epimerase
MSTYQHWHLTRDENNIAWVTFDRDYANPAITTNTFSSAALGELGLICDALAAQPPAGMVVQSAKDNGFAAGADIDEFTNLKSADEAVAFTALGNQVFDKVEALPFATIAMVHGFCMGGGFELALACQYRVMDDSSKTRMGLPEVMIGIVPGWGGAKRLPKLIGAGKALDLMLTGRTVSGRSAHKLGVVDAVTPRRHFANAALDFLKRKPPRHEPGFIDRLTDAPGIRNIVANKAANQVATKASRAHYPAPYAIIELWRDFGGDPRNVPNGHPASLRYLFEHGTAGNLIRIFKLQDRLKALGKTESHNPMQPLKHVHVIGAGVMGGDIAAWCALRGLTVTLQDVAIERIAPAIKRANELYSKKLREPHLVQAALDRLSPDVAGHGVQQADLVIEAIVENAEIKRKVYRDIEPRMKPHAILASNTSSIPLQELSGALVNPDRLIGLHFFNPVAQMMLVEVVVGPQTAPQVMQAGIAFARQIDKLPLPCKSAPGFLVNRVLSPYLHEAMLLIDEGTPPEVIDRAAKDYGMPMGPIELADIVGLDICLAVGEEMKKPGQSVPRELKRRIDEKKLGKKSGEGFYKWVNGKAQKPSASGNNAVNYEALADRLVLPLINESVAALRERIVEDADLIDAGIIFGTGYAPHLGGPINTIKSRGKDQLLEKMQLIRSQLAGDPTAEQRFTPDAGWQSEV